MCEYYVREETSKIERAIYWREKIRKCEHFCEHPKFGEDFWPRVFENFGAQKASKTSIFQIEKREKKKPTNWNMTQICRCIILLKLYCTLVT